MASATASFTELTLSAAACAEAAFVAVDAFAAASCAKAAQSETAEIPSRTEC